MPVISLYKPPDLEVRPAQLEAYGLEQPLRTITGRELSELNRVKLKAPLICQIFNWSEAVEWEGFRFRDVIDFLKLETHPDGYYAVYSSDGAYFETLSALEAADERVLLADTMNGAPLPAAHGGPLRLVVPFLQGYKSVKWVSSVRAFRNDPMGIKKLLGQSLTAQLNDEWTERFHIVAPGVPAAGKTASPLPKTAPEAPSTDSGVEIAMPSEGAISRHEGEGGEPAVALCQILAFLRPGKHVQTRQALEAAGVVAYTTFRVLGRGRQRGLRFPSDDPGSAAVKFLPKQCLSILLEESRVATALEVIQKTNRTGKGAPGDGKIFVLDVMDAVRVSTNERGASAL